MQLKMTKVKHKPLVNCFEVTINYEHGDADATTTSTAVYQNKTLEDMIRFFTKFNEFSEIIEDNPQCGDEICEDGYFLVEPGWYIYPQSDIIYEGTDSYARMSIDKVFYYDLQGEKFAVEIINHLRKNSK